MNKYIIIIEDDRWLAESYRAVLCAAGYTIDIFSSAFEAMKHIDKQLPSLVVADIVLGDHTSFTLFHELQSYEDTAKIPVIVCTGAGTDKLVGGDLESYGIVAILDKSILTPDDLLFSVARHVGSPRRVI